MRRSGLWPLLMAVLCAACDPAPTGERARIKEQLDSAAAAHRADSTAMAAKEDSLRDGHHIYRDREGLLLMEGVLQDGRREGLWTSYERDGKVKSRSEYRNGLAHGLTTVFHPNGNLYYSGDNRDGHPVGEWRFFDLSGGLLRTVRYDSTGTMLRTPG